MDIFCSGDDRHRVILLADLLQRAGQSVTLYTEPTAAPTDPCIVVCSRRALREPWLVDLFSRPASIVAIRLDDAPLPGRCARVVDMQAWPARSADRQVGALVHWLQHGGSGAARWSTAPDGDEARKRSVSGARVRVRTGGDGSEGSGRLQGVLAVLALVAVAGLLLWLAAPDDRPGGESARADVVESREPSPDAASSAGGANGGEQSASLSGRGDSAGSPPARGAVGFEDGGENPGAVVDTVSDTEASGQLQAAALPAALSPGTAMDHLCRARTPEAAAAWARTLNWKQRRRLPEEPCVEALLQRPGFEALEALLF